MRRCGRNCEYTDGGVWYVIGCPVHDPDVPKEHPLEAPEGTTLSRFSDLHRRIRERWNTFRKKR